MSITYKFNILDTLKESGYSTYYIRQKNILSQSTVSKLKNNDTSLTIASINIICKLLNCQPGDLLEYVPDEEIKEETTQKEVPIKKDEEIKNTSKDEIQKEQKEEIPKQVTVQEMKKVAQIKTPFKLKKVGNRNKTNNIS